MADVFSPAKRSEIMGRVRSRGNRATELRLVSIFREHKITGWRRRAKVFGNPDFVFRPARLAVFVDGCFWHGCPVHGSIPANNQEFWAMKLDRNRRRDQIVMETLSGKGWRILRIWQHELRDAEQVARQLKNALQVGTAPGTGRRMGRRPKRDGLLPSRRGPPACDDEGRQSTRLRPPGGLSAMAAMGPKAGERTL